MIGTFWNMCRACPSVPVDKLHSEYRSTYRWHEYTGPRQEIVRRPPQGSFTGHVQEPALPRRKKHPEFAYRTHKILSQTGSEALLEKSFLYDRARSEERWASSQEKNSRRSKSEGPPAGKPSYRLIYTKPIYTPNRSSADAKDRESLFNDENEAPRNSTGFDIRDFGQSEPLRKEFVDARLHHPSRVPNVLQPRKEDVSGQCQPKKSVSMNGIKNRESSPRDTVPVHRRAGGLANKSEGEVLQAVRTNPDSDSNMEDSAQRHDDTDGEFKSEYKKNFQPFNRYDYDESKGVFEKRTPLNSCAAQSEMESPSSSWYKEVMLLRQKANQYRHRGWGTELVPDHIAQLYNDQIMLWEQVSRRSTLSALSLASTVISRDGSPSKEEKENRKNSPVKSLTRARSARASTAAGTHQGKAGEKKAGSHPKASAGKAQAEPSPKKGNNQVKKLGIKRTSPNRTSRESAVGAPPTTHKALNQGQEKPKRRPRPTSLITTVPSGSKAAQSKKKDKSDGEDFPAVDQEQIVKSPPEPTRVKSPEQIVIRSPEPVNWTVPLDTGKTFTVTQNIREGELAPRSFSDAKAWTSNSAPEPPPVSISAPTDLITRANMQGEILTK